MREVKGSIFVMIVKSIKANHNKIGEYEGLLSENAKELLNRRILIGSSYPFELYRELYDTLCLVDAKNNPQTLVEWGKVEGKRVYTTVYASSIVKGDLNMSLPRYSRFHRRVMNFGDIVSEIVSDNEVEFTYIELPHDWENWYHVAVGWAISYIELCIDKKVNYTYLNKSWKGEGWTKVKISWTS